MSVIRKLLNILVQLLIVVTENVCARKQGVINGGDRW